jgi:ABC-type polar amino acid transport system ATPase subunit
VIDDLVRSAAAAGATIVIASHELERARALATSIVQLAGGTVLDRSREEVAAGVP